MLLEHTVQRSTLSDFHILLLSTSYPVLFFSIGNVVHLMIILSTTNNGGKKLQKELYLFSINSFCKAHSRHVKKFSVFTDSEWMNGTDTALGKLFYYTLEKCSFCSYLETTVTLWNEREQNNFLVCRLYNILVSFILAFCILKRCLSYFASLISVFLVEILVFHILFAVEKIDHKLYNVLLNFKLFPVCFLRFWKHGWL